MFHCPVGVWVIEQRAIILSATVRSPTVKWPVTRKMFPFDDVIMDHHNSVASFTNIDWLKQHRD